MTRPGPVDESRFWSSQLLDYSVVLSQGLVDEPLCKRARGLVQLWRRVVAEGGARERSVAVARDVSNLCRDAGRATRWVGWLPASLLEQVRRRADALGMVSVETSVATELREVATSATVLSWLLESGVAVTRARWIAERATSVESETEAVQIAQDWLVVLAAADGGAHELLLACWRREALRLIALAGGAQRRAA